MNRRWAARLAAPAAFLAGVTVAILLVRAGLDDEATTAAQTSVATTAPRTTTATPTRPRPRPAVYVRVAAGDTLDQIALDNDTSVERLLTLNQGLDPTALQVGQRIRVR